MHACLRIVAGLLGIGLLSGCLSSFQPKSGPTLYTLDDAEAAAVATMPLPAHAIDRPTLIVAATRAAAGFDTAHIVYTRRAAEIEYFANSQWVDMPAHMLAPMMARMIEQTGTFHAVVSAPTAVAAQWRLDTRLIRLQQDFSTQPSAVRLTLHAELFDATTRRIVAQREFDVRVAAASDNPYGGVLAARAATHAVLAELAAFCAQASVRQTPRP